eukprot:GHUV01030762.1.p1 GENE.GHUV01030762.1~~GHUV01030762.1.p1  ORF type:complete len:121 (+),score=27.49 GHUV01030762.1:145-507(+)
MCHTGPVACHWVSAAQVHNELSNCQQLLVCRSQMGKVRIRQHVNPLESRFQQPTAAPDWSAIYSNPQLPLFVDMGCGPGRFLLLLCKRHRQLQQPINCLGLEIRQQVSLTCRSVQLLRTA